RHCQRYVLTTLRGMAFDEDIVAVEVETQRDVAHHGCMFHVRQRPQAFRELAIELLSTRFVITLQAEVERHRERILCVEPRIHGLQLLQRAHDESGGDEDHERDRDLRDYEHTTKLRLHCTTLCRSVF